MRTFIVKFKATVTGRPEVTIKAEAVTLSHSVLTFTVGDADVAQFHMDALAGWYDIRNVV